AMARRASLRSAPIIGATASSSPVSLRAMQRRSCRSAADRMETWRALGPAGNSATPMPAFLRAFVDIVWPLRLPLPASRPIFVPISGRAVFGGALRRRARSRLDPALVPEHRVHERPQMETPIRRPRNLVAERRLDKFVVEKSFTPEAGAHEGGHAFPTEGRI